MQIQAQLLIGNDQLINVIGAQDAVTEFYLNAATVTARVTDLDGNDVAGQSWPTPLAYLAGTDGNYQGTLEDGMVLTAGQSYLIKVTIDNGGDEIGYWQFPRIARYRIP